MSQPAVHEAASSRESQPNAEWLDDLSTFLTPFLRALPRVSQRHWAPLYVQGLLGPGDRKSVEPMAARVCPQDGEQLHHFVNAAPWDPGPLEAVLGQTAAALVGRPEAVLVIDDTSLVKQGTHSVGVAKQYCGSLRKVGNCQALVSLTLACDEVPVPLALRLYLPPAWSDDPVRRARAKIPADVVFQTKGQLALAELDRVIAAGVRPGREFGVVTADAAYGRDAKFRAALTDRGLTWAVGIDAAQTVYPMEVQLERPPARGRRQHPVPTIAGVTAKVMIEAVLAQPDARMQQIRWRRGTKGPLLAGFTAVRVRVADGPRYAGERRLPGTAVWLVCEERSSGDRKYHLTNHPPQTGLLTLARAIKSRWVCEQMHQQLKEELGLDHFEGRSWRGLHHHALLTMVAFTFLQARRLRTVHDRQGRRGKKTGTAAAGATAGAVAAGRTDGDPRALRPPRASVSTLSSPPNELAA